MRNTSYRYSKNGTRWKQIVTVNSALYCGVSLDWHYDQVYVDIAMSSYVNKNLIRYNHKNLNNHNIAPTSPSQKTLATKQTNNVTKTRVPPPKTKRKLFNRSTAAFSIMVKQ